MSIRTPGVTLERELELPILERTEDAVTMLELLGAIELVVATDERELGVTELGATELGATELGATELAGAIEELLGRELEVALELARGTVAKASATPW